jgi:hypothetical protein
MNKIIIGRKFEMSELQRSVESDRSEFVIVYGRRRVGKTYLVDTFFNGVYDFTFVGGHKLTKEKQLRNFAKALKKCADLNKQPVFKAWDEAFDALAEYLESLPKEKRKVVFIDEMPWIDTPKSDFVEALEEFWNGWAARRSDIVFIASGSASSWMMDKLVDNPGGLHARITNNIYVRPFTLKETKEYLYSRGIQWSNYHILQLYMIMGGVPFYLSLLDKKETMINNIDRLFFRQNGALALEFDELYNAIFSRADRYSEIVELLYDNGRAGMTYDQIRKATNMDGKFLATILKNLVRCDFVIAYSQFGNQTKGTIYRLSDFYTLFYYKFVARADSKDEQWWTHNYHSHSVESWQGLTFELSCLTHLNQIRKALGISGISTSASSWRYTPKKDEEEKGAQIDLVIERGDRCINLCEMKFSATPYTITGDYANRIRERMGLFKTKTKTACSLMNTFVTTFGVAKGVHSEVVDSEVTADDLFEE